MKIRFALFLAILASTTLDANAGAWLQQEGHGLVIRNLRLYYTEQEFDSNGDRNSRPIFAKADFSPYFEYGLFENLTIGGEIDAAYILDENNGQLDSAYDLSYASLFARAYLYKGDNFVASVEPGLTYPRAINSDLTSDGEKIIPELKLDFGYNFGFNDRRHFLDLSAKYRERHDNGLEDMLKFEATVGITLIEEYTLLAQVTHEETFGGSSTPGNYDLTKPQLSVLFNPSEYRTYQFAVFYNVDGENTGSGGGVMYSVWYKF